MNTDSKNPIRGLIVGFGATLLFVLAWIFVALLAGCASAPGEPPPSFSPDGTNKVPRAALVVNLTRVSAADYDGWSGDCVGTDKDAALVKSALDGLGIPYLHLENETATVRGVKAAARAVCSRVAPGGLCLLYFSGHGGQQPAFGAELDELDELDETICLYDGRLLDDVVWAMLADVPAGVRVWMVTDCCNAGTNYRAGPPHDYAPAMSSWWRKDPDLLHWGAAKDGQSAIGSPAGGFFTLALEQAFVPGMTYREWFDAARPLVGGRQKPVMNFTGTDFSDKEAFR